MKNYKSGAKVMININYTMTLSKYANTNKFHVQLTERAHMAIKKNQYIPQIRFHPGETLSEKLEEMGMSSEDFSVFTGKSEKIINAFLNGKIPVTPDMAVQFENVTEIPVHFWLNSQRQYDEFIAMNKYEEVIEEEAILAE